MKLRLTQPGFTRYTGQMGVIQFEDGLSTTDVLPIDAIRMAAVMLCLWEDGSSPSIAQSILDNADTAAPMFEKAEPTPASASAPESTTDAKPECQLDTQSGTQSDQQSGQQSEPPAVTYTEDQLAAIADKEGIKGLRVIGDALGIKANSIKDMIAAILAHAGAKVA